MKRKKKILSIGSLLLAVLLLQGVTTYAGQAEGGAQTDTRSYEVEFTLGSQWEGAFRGSLCIKNTGTRSIEDWRLRFSFLHELEEITGAKIISHEGHTYVLGHEEWNRRILPGQSVTISFGARWENEISKPREFELLETRKEEKEAYEIRYETESDWGSGFTAVLRITNQSGEDMESWQLAFDFNREIESVWDGQLIGREGNRYVIENAGYNAVIHPGETVSVGLQGKGGKPEEVPVNYVLSAVSWEPEREMEETEYIGYFPEKEAGGETEEWKRRVLRLLAE